MKSTALARTTPLARTAELARRTELKRTTRPRLRAVSPATREQKLKVLDRACIVCGAGPSTPAHLIDRSLAPGDGDDTRLVVPLCAACHFEYDEGDLDLSPYLEPHYREEVAAAVEAVGLFAALRRITGRRWVPVPDGFDRDLLAADN